MGHYRSIESWGSTPPQAPTHCRNWPSKEKYKDCSSPLGQAMGILPRITRGLAKKMRLNFIVHTCGQMRAQLLNRPNPRAYRLHLCCQRVHMRASRPQRGIKREHWFPLLGHLPSGSLISVSNINMGATERKN